MAVLHGVSQPARPTCPPSLSTPHPPRRYGVNGGGGGVGIGLSQRLRGWLVDAMGSGKAVRTSPYGS